jgi:hypothetical protein
VKRTIEAPMSEPLGDDYERVHDILHDAELHATRLTDWEQEFAEDMLERVRRYGDVTHVSEKQMAIIDRIARKIYG